jgi:hypothetical protein
MLSPLVELIVQLELLEETRDLELESHFASAHGMLA